MKYYVKFDADGTLIDYMEYAHYNGTMEEVSQDEYREILERSGIPYNPEPAPEPTASLEARVETLETETAAISAAIERGMSL